ADAFRGPGAPRADRLEIVAAVDGRTQAVAPVADGPMKLPLHIDGGIHDVALFPRLHGSETRPELALLQNLRIADR
ncbi:MAG: hypothetical protein JWQ20_526, partial [Conexibacter sp.]|nr:hypothetical protein [Conexibacter sp.]